MGLVDATLGALFVGVVLAAILFGLTCMQVWCYYIHYPSDPWYNKLIVAVVLLSDACHQALITHAVYVYCISRWGESDALTKIVWSLIVENFFNALTTFVVQCYLAMRVYRLSRSVPATAFIGALIIAELVSTFVFSVNAVRMQTIAQLTTLRDLSRTINILAAVGDVLIAALLCIALQKSRTGFHKSDTMINKLLMYSINTGALTSIDALASTICITVWPHSFAYITFYFCIGRLYSNSLLASLNARQGLRAGSTTDEMIMDVQSRDGGMPFGAPTNIRGPNSISIKIDTTREYAQDQDNGTRKSEFFV